MRVLVSAWNVITLGAFADQINALETAGHALWASQSGLMDVIVLICMSGMRMHIFGLF